MGESGVAAHPEFWARSCNLLQLELEGHETTPTEEYYMEPEEVRVLLKHALADAIAAACRDNGELARTVSNVDELSEDDLQRQLRDVRARRSGARKRRASGDEPARKTKRKYDYDSALGPRISEWPREQTAAFLEARGLTKAADAANAP